MCGKTLSRMSLPGDQSGHGQASSGTRPALAMCSPLCLCNSFSDEQFRELIWLKTNRFFLAGRYLHCVSTSSWVWIVCQNKCAGVGGRGGEGGYSWEYRGWQDPSALHVPAGTSDEV